MPDIDPDLSQLPEKTFEAGETIIAEGQPSGGLFFLVSGTVAVSKEGVEIHKINTAGAVFGEMSYLLDCPTTATVMADTRCVMRVVADNDAFLREHPEMALYIARIVAARMDSVVRYLVDLKSQFSDYDGHFGMVNEILDAIINKHPRSIDKELRERDLVDDD